MDCKFTASGTLGSIPETAKVLYSHRLTVRTPGFHPGNRSSILRGCTSFTIAGRVRSPAGSHKPLPSLVQIQALQPNNSAVAQLVERKTVNFDVRGSRPRCGAKTKEGWQSGRLRQS